MTYLYSFWILAHHLDPRSRSPLDSPLLLVLAAFFIGPFLQQGVVEILNLIMIGVFFWRLTGIRRCLLLGQKRETQLLICKIYLIKFQLLYEFFRVLTSGQKEVHRWGNADMTYFAILVTKFIYDFFGLYVPQFMFALVQYALGYHWIYKSLQKFMLIEKI